TTRPRGIGSLDEHRGGPWDSPRSANAFRPAVFQGTEFVRVFEGAPGLDGAGSRRPRPRTFRLVRPCDQSQPATVSQSMTSGISPSSTGAGANRLLAARSPE